MVKEYFRDVRPGDSLFKEAWSARAYNRRSRAIQHDNNFVRGSNNHYITTEAFHGYWTDDDEPLVKLVRLKKDLLPSFLTDNDQSSLSSSSNKKEDDGTNAIVLYHNGDDWADSDPPEEIYVSDVFGLPYDKNDRHWVTFHPEFGRWVILDRNTIRVAVTVKDDDGTYPKAEDTPNVYPIEFVTPTYKKDSGKQDIDFKEKHGEAQPDWMQPPHAYCANLWNNYPDAYIPEGTPIWCFWQWQQWFTFVCCGQTDERSSGSSSSVISNRQTYTMRKTSVPSGQGKPGGPYLFEYVMSEKTPEEIARSGGGQPDEQGRTSPGDTPGGPVSGGGGGGGSVTGYSGTKTVVVATTCTAGTLSVTTEQWTFVNGTLISIA